VYGVEVLARAFVLAAHQRPDLRLFLLGNGSLAPEIRRILMPVQEMVRFEGQVPQERLPAYYQAADLYLSASHSDGSSVSLMEALASGKPALVSDIPGNREWIGDGQAGWLFPDGDAEALAEGILRAAADSDALLRAGTQARALAEVRADWRVNFKQLLKAYNLALGVRSRP
jgi:glycosyltransferase involved in cell wall biosynthesis